MAAMAAPMPADEIMNAFYKTLEGVLSITDEQAKALVTDFNTRDLAFFQTYFEGLPSAKLEKNSNVKNANSKVVTLFVEGKNIGAGAFGVIKKNRTENFVYKYLKDKEAPEKRLIYLKSIFQEAIIQTLLQSDATHGQYICQLYKVYRQGNDCIFQMEPLETTFEKRIGLEKDMDIEAYEMDPKPINALVLKVLLKVLEIINYFNRTYGFCHNDLSISNIMMPKSGNGGNGGNEGNGVKLIDFGKSSVWFGKIQIGIPSKYRIDPQYLIQKLQTILDINPTKFSKKLETLLELPSNTQIQTYIDYLQQWKNNTRKNGGKRRRTIRKRS